MDEHDQEDYNPEIDEAFGTSGNKAFDDVVSQMLAVHRDKSHDYANQNNAYANFERQAGITNTSVDMVFFNAIAIKIARLTELVGNSKEPKNESIDDTILDLANYAAIWLSWRQRAPF